MLITGGQYNIGHICTRAQCDNGHAAKTALRWISPTLERTDISFADLEKASNRFANALLAAGFQRGSKIFIFLPKTPELFVAFLGILKIQAVACILFSNFGEEGLMDRLGDGQAECVITRASLKRKILAIRAQIPSLRTILLIDGEDDPAAGLIGYQKFVETASDQYETPITPADTPSVLHYTSGSTGKPKGVLHVHRSVLTQNQTTLEVLQLKPEDLYWCTADQAWVTGVSYGIIGPWSLGVTQIQFGGNFDPAGWFTILDREKINVWYTAPTALRLLRQEDPALYAPFDLSNLRSIFSVGEPLNPEVLYWARKILGREVYDTWFQTETGSIMISNAPGIAVKAGSMGRPVQGIEAGVFSEEGARQDDNQVGHLCLRPGWPSMFIDYLNRTSAYREKFKHDLYYTGDTAYRDSDGYFWFLGRADDLINTAGHLVGPFEVESALIEMEEIAEAGVIGAPDEILFEKVVAYLHLKPDVVWSKMLELKIRLHVSNRLSSVATPQDFRIVESIPKNKSGKILRRILKAWYLGLDAGDISTLEV